MQGKQQLCRHLLYESLVGQFEYTTQPKVPITFLIQRGQKWAENKVLWGVFFNLAYNESFCHMLYFSKTLILGKLDSRDMRQNALGQSDSRIFKSTISLEKNDEKTCVFSYWYKFMEIKDWSKNIRVGMIKMGGLTMVTGI